MKFLGKFVLLGIMIFSLLNIAKADIIPDDSHRFSRCVKIENPEEIEGFKLIIRIDVLGGTNAAYQVENNTCLKGHYLGSSTPYLVQKDINIENLNIIAQKVGGDQKKFESYLGNIFTRFDRLDPNGGYTSNSSNKTYENIIYKLVFSGSDYNLIVNKYESDDGNVSGKLNTLQGYTTNLNKGNDKIMDNSKNLGETYDNGYSKEFNDAYDFAYQNRITTMNNIYQANMDGTLNRIAMAKMLSQYAINVLNKNPDTTKHCNFLDVSNNLDRAYAYGVTLACQLGIMGVNVDTFRPNDLVTRAEFATALSRLLYGTSDGKNSYYSAHLEILKDKGIINNTNPKLHEKRGYVMLMLMRSRQ